jgi:hypothetical protein
MNQFNEISESIQHEEDLEILEAREGLDNDLEMPKSVNEASNELFSAFVKFRQILEQYEVDSEIIKEFRSIRDQFEKLEDKISF